MKTLALSLLLVASAANSQAVFVPMEAPLQAPQSTYKPPQQQIYSSNNGEVVVRSQRQGDAVTFTDPYGRVVATGRKIGNTMVYTDNQGRVILNAQGE